MTAVPQATRAEICVAACADAWRGDGEILASPMGVIPTLGARLARASFAPDLLLSDGQAYLLAGDVPLGAAPDALTVEGWLPYRAVLDLAAGGRRHVMMGPSQIDAHGNANISCVGPWSRPIRQLLGTRGAPGNTVNHATSYWVPKHAPRTFVEHVDVVCGLGYDRAAAVGHAARFHTLRRVVTNLCVLDFGGPGHRMRLASLHPGVTVDQVVAATGFDLTLPARIPATRQPTDAELRVLRDVLDPRAARDREIPA
ncbi:CoA-transferase [Streptomyces sp. NPDC051976]|uniref:CoA-transferase subunit beta n=1 Tax=Streptomyces sp. NPDC051976 TaxID=3154947 RepID=UPI00344AF13C